MGVFKTFTSEHKDFEYVNLQVYINKNNEIYLKIEDEDSSYPIGIILDIEDTKELIFELQRIINQLEK